MPRPKKYPVRLSDSEYATLMKIVTTGKQDAFARRRAEILLCLDQNHGEVLPMKEIAARCHVTAATLHNTSRQFYEEGFSEDFLKRKPRQKNPRKITGEVEAQVIAKACSPAPEGFSKWTVRLIADRLVLDNGEKVSASTVQQVLKKHR